MNNTNPPHATPDQPAVSRRDRVRHWRRDRALAVLCDTTSTLERKLICAIISIIRDRDDGLLANRRTMRWNAADLRKDYSEIALYPAGTINPALPRVVERMRHPDVSLIVTSHLRAKLYDGDEFKARFVTEDNVPFVVIGNSGQPWIVR